MALELCEEDKKLKQFGVSEKRTPRWDSACQRFIGGHTCEDGGMGTEGRASDPAKEGDKRSLATAQFSGSFSQARGMFLSQSCLSEESDVPVTLSHWLERHMGPKGQQRGPSSTSGAEFHGSHGGASHGARHFRTVSSAPHPLLLGMDVLSPLYG